MLDNTLDLLHKHNSITTISEDTISDIVNALLSDEVTKKYSNVILADGETETTSDETTTEGNEEENTINDEGATEQDKFDVEDKVKSIGEKFYDWKENLSKNHPFAKKFFTNLGKAGLDIMLHGAGGADPDRLFSGLYDAFWKIYEGNENKYKDYATALQKLYNDKTQKFSKYYDNVIKNTIKGGAKVGSSNITKIIENTKDELGKTESDITTSVSSIISSILPKTILASNEELANKLKQKTHLCNVPTESIPTLLNNFKVKASNSASRGNIICFEDVNGKIRTASSKTISEKKGVKDIIYLITLQDNQSGVGPIVYYYDVDNKTLELQPKELCTLNNVIVDELKEEPNVNTVQSSENKEDNPQSQSKNPYANVFSNLLGITHILLSNGSSAIFRRGTEDQLKALPNGNNYVKDLENICKYIDDMYKKQDTNKTVLEIANKCNNTVVMAFTNLLYIILVNLQRDLNNISGGKNAEDNNIYYYVNGIEKFDKSNAIEDIVKQFKNNQIECMTDKDKKKMIIKGGKCNIVLSTYSTNKNINNTNIINYKIFFNDDGNVNTDIIKQISECVKTNENKDSLKNKLNNIFAKVK